MSLVGLPLLPTLDIDIGLYVTVVGVKAVKAVKDWLLFIKENKENKENKNVIRVDYNERWPMLRNMKFIECENECKTIIDNVSTNIKSDAMIASTT